MSKHLTLDNQKYLSSQAAGKVAGYTPDYIGKMCREGTVSCRRIGRAWFVEETSLKEHVVRLEHARAVRKEELSKERKEEYEAPEIVATQKIISERIAKHAKHVKETAAKVYVENKDRVEKGVVAPIVTKVENIQKGFVTHRLEQPITSTYFRKRLIETGDIADGFRKELIVRTPIVPANPVYTFAQKSVALLTATALVFGTSALSHAQYRNVALNTLEQEAAKVTQVFKVVPNALANVGDGFDTSVMALSEFPLQSATRIVGKNVLAQVSALDLLEGAYFTVQEFFGGLNTDITSNLTFVGSGNSRGHVELSVKTLKDEVDTEPRITVETTSVTESMRASLYTPPQQSGSGNITNIINQPVTERVIETQTLVTQSGVSLVDLQQLENELRQEIVRVSTVSAGAVSNNFGNIALTQRIDTLGDVDISNSRITNSSIEATTLTVANSATFNGTATFAQPVTFTDITLTGDLVVTGATTLATSTITNATITTGTVTDLTTTNATSTNLFATNGVITNATTTDFFTTNGALTNATATNLFATSSTLVNATSTNFFTTLVTAVTAELTNVTAVNATSTNFFATNLSATNAELTNATSTDFVATNSATLATTSASSLSIGTLSGFLKATAGTVATALIDLTADVTGILPDANVSDTLTINASSTVADGALSANVSLLGQTIESSEITNETITAADLATSSVTTTEILDGTITTSDISNTAAITDAQVNNDLTINGGTIENTPIGASTPNTGVFTDATTTNFIATNATSTNFFTSLFTALTAEFTNITAVNATTTNLVATNSATLATTTVSGSLTVNGDANIIGDTFSDTLTVNASINSDLIPDQNAVRDLGSPSFYWDEIYADNINVNSISAASTTIGGTANNSFSINTDNVTTDTEDISLVFFRGTVVPNAVITWDSTRDRFDINQPFFIQNDSSTTTVPTLHLVGSNSQTAPILAADTYSGSRALTVDVDGNVGIGTTTPNALLVLDQPGTSALDRSQLQIVSPSGNIITGSIVGGIDFISDDLGAYADAAYIRAIGAGNHISSSAPTDLVFSVSASGTTTPAERLRITSAGNVGIGTTSPASTLDVWGDFRVGTSSTPALFTDVSSGNVGIGTASPTVALDVSGAASVSSTLSVGGIVLEGSSATSDNFVINSDDNTVESGTIVNTILGGRSGWSNIIGTTGKPNGSDFTPTDWADDTGYVATSASIATISGGYDNIVNQLAGTIAGGGHNFIKYNSSGHSIIGGGSYNLISAGRSGIFSGRRNTITGAKVFSFIGGGDDNNIVGNYSAILGGLSNTVTGDFAFAFGRRANASAHGAVVFADNTDADFSVTTANVFGTRYSGGYWLTGGNVGIGTTTPAEKLTVAGTARITGDTTLESALTLSALTGGILTTDSSGVVSTTTISASVIDADSLDFTEFKDALTVDATTTFNLDTNNADLNFDNSTLYIDSSVSMVGIGDPTPSNKLGVQGALRVGSGYNNIVAPSEGAIIEGNVGIGTSNPDNQLDVNGSALTDVVDVTGEKIFSIVRESSVIYSPRASYSIGRWTDVTNRAKTALTLSLLDETASHTDTDTDVMTWLSSGNVGIGTTTPASKLDVWGDLRVGTSSTPALFTDVSSGNVGVGTAAPEYKLDIQGTSANGTISDSIKIEQAGTGSGTGSGILLGYSTVQARIAGFFDGTGAALSFSTDVGAGLSEKVRITSTGNVGIGTTSPASTLDVWGDLRVGTSSTPALFTDVSSGKVGIGTVSPEVLFDVQGTGSPAIRVGNGTAYTQIGYDGANFRYNLNSSGSVLFGYNSGNSRNFNFYPLGATTPSVAFSSTGSVGIGTTTPVATLTVQDSAARAFSVYDDSSNEILTVQTNLVNQDRSKITIYNSQILIDSSNVGGTDLYMGIETGGNLDAYVYASGRDLNLGAGSNTAILTLNSNENVGIGTTTPGEKLTVAGTARITGDTTLASALTLSALTGGILTTNSSGVVATTTISASVVDADTLDFTEFKDALALDASTDIAVDGSEELSITNTGTGNSFVVNDVASDTTPFVIDASGNVGIGTSTPEETLHIYNSDPSIKLSNTNSPSNYRSVISHNWDTSNGFGIYSGNNLTQVMGAANNVGSVFFPNGNVGIGTTTPAQQLTVAGTARITGDTTLESALTLSALTGGLLTTNSSGVVSTTTISASVIDADTLDFTEFKDALALDASTDIAVDGSEVLSITNTGTGDSFVVNDTGSDTSPFVIDASGNVGVGITAPTRKLDVLTNSTSLISRFGTDSGAGYIYFTNSSVTDDKVRIGANGTRLALSTNYAERLSIDNAGNVGIGTTTPASKLDVWGDLRVGTSSTPALFTDVSSGNVGVGTNAPDGTLHVYSTGNADIYAERSGGAKIKIQGQASIGQIGTQSNHNLQLISNGSARMTLTTAGNVGIGTTTPEESLHIYTSDPSIKLSNTNSPTGYRSVISHNWDTNNGFGIYSGTNLTQVMGAANNVGSVFFPNGNIGIGTTTPEEKLVVNADTSFEGILLSHSGSTSIVPSFRITSDRASDGQTMGEIVFENPNGGANNRAAGIRASRGSTDAKADLSIITNNNVRLTVDEDGNVGIGISTPSEKLHIDATTNALIVLNSDTDNSGIAESGLSLQDDDVQRWGIVKNNANDLKFNRYDASGVFQDQPLSIGGSTGIVSIPDQLQRSGGVTRLVGTSDVLGVAVDASGNVGIGSTTPGAKLHVSGGYLKLDDTYSLFWGGGEGEIVYDASDNLTFQTSDADRLTIDSSGNVGIGTTSPNQLLQIHDASTNNQAIQFTGNASGSGSADGTVLGSFGSIDFQAWNFEAGDFRIGTNNTERLRIDSSGNVGIGTVSPNHLLELSQATAPQFGFTRDDSTITDTNGLGLIYFNGTDGGQQGGANIKGEAAGTWATGDSPGRLLFRTTPVGSASAQTRLTIDSTGNVGIATTSPASTLDVWGDLRVGTSSTPALFSDVSGGNVGIGTAAPTELLTITAPAATPAKIRLNGRGGGNAGYIVSDAGTGFNLQSGINSSGYITFDTTTGGSITERVRIANDGNVGIGTTNPTSTIAGTALSVSTQGARTTGDGIGSLSFITNDSSYTGTYADGIGAEVSAISDSATGAAYGLTFTTGTITSSNRAERVRITSTGNVGIGTTTPSAKLDVLGDTNIQGTLQIRNSSNLGNLAISDNGGGTATINNVGNSYLNISSAVSTNFTSGNVGIGTTTPASTLDVWGDLRVGTSSTPALFTDVSSGNVGIGTASAVASLHVAGATTPTGADTSGSDSFNGLRVGTPGFAVALDMGTQPNSGPLYSWIQSRQRNNYASNYNLILNPNGGNVGIGTTSPYMKLSISGGGLRVGTNTGTDFGYQIIRDANGTYGATNSLVFKAEQSGGAGYSFQDYAGTSLVQITNDGNVGIGTTSPAQKLHVDGNARVTKSDGSGSFYTQNIYITDNAGDTVTNRIDNDDSRLYVTYGGGSNKALSILNSNGSVGIGTTTPTTKLSVNGALSLASTTPATTVNALYNVSGSLYWNGSEVGSGAALFTDGGTTTYLTSLTDDLAIGGTTSDAPLFFDESASALSLNPFGTSAGNTGEVRFEELEANGDNYVALKAPDAITSNTTFTLPTADGTAGQFLTTDASGNLSFATAGDGISPSFSVHRNNVAQSIPGNTWTKVAWTTEHFDTNSDFASDRFTPTVAGKYLLTTKTRFESVSDSDQTYMAIYKNGALYSSDYKTSTGTFRTNQVSVVVDANGTTDYFEVYVHQSSASNKDINGWSAYTSFTGSRIDGGNGLWTHNSPDISYTAGNVGIGTTSPSNVFHVDSTDFSVFERSSAQTNDFSASGAFIHTTSNDMVDGFGSGIAFAIQDSAATRNYIGRIIAARDGADTEGALTFLAGTNGLEEFMRISASGNVGIGTTSPASTLDVWGDLRVGTSSTPALFTDVSSGNVGIGTDAPAYKLHVSGQDEINVLINGSTRGIRMASDSNGSSIEGVDNTGVSSYQPLTLGGSFIPFTTSGVERVRIDSSGNVGIGDTTPAAALTVGNGDLFQVNSSGAIAAATGVTSTGDINTTNGNLGFGGYDNGISPHNNTGWGFRMTNAASKYYTDLVGAYGSNSGGGARIVRNGSIGGANDGTVVAIFDYDGTGNVGIGTEAPSYKLHVQGTDGVPASIRTEATSADSDAFFVSDNDANVWSAGIDGDTSDAYMISNAFGLGTPKLTITTSGNVGIGTTTPASKLHVYSGEAGGTAAGSADDLIVEHSTTGGISILTPDADLSRLYFGSASDTSGAWAQWQYGTGGATKTFTLGSLTTGGQVALTSGNGVEAMRIDSSGNVGIGTTTPEEKLSINVGNNNSTVNFDVVSISPLIKNTITTTGTVARQDLSGITMGVGSSASSNYQGYLAFSTTPSAGTLTERMRIAAGGTVSIGTANASVLLNVSSVANKHGVLAEAESAGYAALYGKSSLNASNGYPLLATNTGAGVTCVMGNTAAFTCSSDERLKSDITEIPNALEKLSQIQGVSYKWTKSGPDSDTHLGVIAQDVLDVFPEAVNKITLPGETEEEAYYGVEYTAFIAPLIQGVNELNARTSFLNSATTTEQMFIDENGNIGIGTSSPAYKLHVVGDVAATAFVNTSTGALKTNITYLADGDEDDILEKIRTEVNVAQYHYTSEDQENPLRLGLIAEEAPTEVLSVDGKGVDIYKLATFTLAGVKAQQTQIDAIDVRLQDIEATIAAGSSDTSGVVAVVVRWFEEIGIVFSESIAKFNNLAAVAFTVGTSEQPNGITLYDKATGEAYCVEIENGQMVNTAGVCSTTSSPTSATPPTLTLIGTNPANIALNANYSDLGITAKDSDGNDLTVTYTLNGTTTQAIEIDTTIDATHTITYSATDSNEQTTTIERTVIVGTGVVVAVETESTDTATTTTTDTVVEETTEDTTATSTEPIIVETPEPTEDTTATTTEEAVEEVVEEVVEETVTTATTTPTTN